MPLRPNWAATAAWHGTPSSAGAALTLATASPWIAAATSTWRESSTCHWGSPCGPTSVAFDAFAAKLNQGTPGYASSPAAGSSIDVGRGKVGSLVTAALTISETGNAPLTVTVHSLGGSNAADFSVSPATFSILDGGAGQQLSIHCTPGGSGLRTASLTVKTTQRAVQQRIHSLARAYKSCICPVLPINKVVALMMGLPHRAQFSFRRGFFPTRLPLLKRAALETERTLYQWLWLFKGRLNKFSSPVPSPNQPGSWASSADFGEGAGG